MTAYQVPEATKVPKVASNEAILIANGDLRLSANQMCWPAQDDMEKRIIAAFAKEGIADQNGREVQQHLERRLHRRVLPEGHPPVDQRRQDHARRQPCPRVEVCEVA